MELPDQNWIKVFAAGVISFALIITSYCFLSWKSNSKTAKTPPLAKGAWPIVGHLPMLLGSKDLLQETLAKMADAYGPIFTIRLGIHPTVVISSPAVAKECFTKNDHALSSRPKLLAAELVCYNYAMFGIAPYGPYWRDLRKISTMDLLSNHTLEVLKHVRTSEVDLAIKELYNLWTQRKDESGRVRVDLKTWFYGVSLNIIIRMVGGDRCYGSGAQTEDTMRCQKAWSDMFHMLGVLVVADYVPFLRWLDIAGHEKRMKEVAKELDCILQGWIDEHRLRRIKENDSSRGQDFVDVLLSVLGDKKLGGYKPDDVNKATVMDMIGGSDTIAVAHTWALALLLNNGPALKKAQDELDMKIGKDREVNESDIPKLVYLQAIVKETLRLYPSAPLAAQHLVTEDCHIGGYHVRQGTRLIANLHKIQRDPSMWINPLEFQPERFLTTNLDVDVRGSQQFELIPFGAGRRKCPGITLGLQMVQLILAALLHGFEITATSDAPIDMTGSPGLTNMKATPLEVLIKPRLSENLYQ